jgi:hypothetical protein
MLYSKQWQDRLKMKKERDAGGEEDRREWRRIEMA